VVPCTVNSRLNTSGRKKWPSGNANCVRMSAAKLPATAKNKSEVAMYITPSRL
jgi:hypothetical protein